VSGDEDFRQELPQRVEGKLGDHYSGALRARLRQETTLSVKTIADRMHLGPPKRANARLYGWMRQSVPQPPPQLRPNSECESERATLWVSRMGLLPTFCDRDFLDIRAWLPYTHFQ